MSNANALISIPKTLQNLRILIVDNDRDTRDLYGFLLKSYGAEVKTFGSIEDTLDALNEYIPNLLICEMRFLGESVLPLIQRIRDLARSNGISIPILGASTCSPENLAQPLQGAVEAYFIKPIEINDLVAKVRDLTFFPSIAYPPTFAVMPELNSANLLACAV